jgi:choline transporter-like protein 2/4/5
MGGPLGAIIGRYPSATTTGAGGEDAEQLGRDSSSNLGIIRHDRRCRDLAFLVLFAAFWVAMIVNSSFGFNQGNPLRSATRPPPQIRPPPSRVASRLVYFNLDLVF